MVVDISVVVPCPASSASSIVRLLRSLDKQTVRSDQFEVLVAVSDATDTTTLDLLSKARPNVRITSHEASDPEALLVQAVSEARGDYVLIARPDDVIFREALERLVDFARTSDVNVVIGRSVGSGIGDERLLKDGAPLPVDDFRKLIDQPAVLYSRALLTQDVRGRADADSLLERGASAGAYGQYPLLKLAKTLTTPAADQAIQLARPLFQWVQGQLQLTVEGTFSGAAPEPTAARVQIVLREVSTGLELLAPTTSDVTTDAGRATVTAHAQIDVLSTAGTRLNDGSWELMARVLSNGAGVVDCPIPSVLVPRGLIHGVYVVPRNAKGNLQLDIGATRGGFLRAADPIDISLAESVAGSLLTLKWPDFYTLGEATIDGHCGVGGLKLPAQLISDGSTIKMECFVSGLIGTYVLSTHFGTGPGIPTGLQLAVSGAGAMTVQPASIAQAKPAKPAEIKTKTTEPASSVDSSPAEEPNVTEVQRPAARLRRLLPTSFDPAVHALSKVPPARWAYRKAIGLK